jgi:uncharacterized protein with NRDE domain
VHARPAGVHALANDRLGSPQFPKTARAERLLDAATLASLDEAALRARLTAVLADGEVPATAPEPAAGSLIPAEFARRLQALCVRTPVYGTVSATVLLLGDGAVHGYWYADGAPDVTALREVRRAPTAE